MYCVVLSRIDLSGFFTTSPSQMLSAAVAEGHEFTLHGYVAPRAYTCVY